MMTTAAQAEGTRDQLERLTVVDSDEDVMSMEGGEMWDDYEPCEEDLVYFAQFHHERDGLVEGGTQVYSCYIELEGKSDEEIKKMDEAFFEKNLVCEWNKVKKLATLKTQNKGLPDSSAAGKALSAFSCGFSTDLAMDVLHGHKAFIGSGFKFMESLGLMSEFDIFMKSFEEMIKHHQKHFVDVKLIFINESDFHMVSSREFHQALENVMSYVFYRGISIPENLHDLFKLSDKQYGCGMTSLTGDSPFWQAWRDPGSLVFNSDTLFCFCDGKYKALTPPLFHVFSIEAHTAAIESIESAMDLCSPILEESAENFVGEYYYVLNLLPDVICKFYRGSSVIRRPGGDVTFRDVPAKEAKLLFLPEQPDSITISRFEKSECNDVGVLVTASGYFIMKDNAARKKFIQSFTLATLQGHAYIVVEDVFTYVDEDEATIPESPAVAVTGFPENVSDAHDTSNSDPTCILKGYP